MRDISNEMRSGLFAGLVLGLALCLEIAEAFRMQVLVAESLVPGSEKDDSRTALDELYRRADIVSIHSPLSPYTDGLVDGKAFSLMKPTALLLNMGRGGIVNEQALLTALNDGSIAGAALDVLAQEPPAQEHPLLKAKLSNLIITPHTAWASQQARQALIGQVCDILNAFAAGSALPNTVN